MIETIGKCNFLQHNRDSKGQWLSLTGRYLFEKLTNYQNDNEIYKLLPGKINTDVVSKFKSGAK